MKQIEPLVVEIDDVGLVLFKSSKRYKRVSIRLKPFEGVEVLYPTSCHINRAIEFVETKKEWINQARKKIKKQEERLTIFDENTIFETKSFKLQIKKHTGTNVRILLNKNILHISYPENIPVSNPPIQEAVRFGIEKAMRLEAKRILPLRLSLLAAQHEFIYKNVYIKNLKSRWGSCSFENNINLNLQLIRLPDYLIDYVLLHELCHTKEKNHGPNFWNLLNKCTCNKAKQFAEEMKNYRTQIY